MNIIFRIEHNSLKTMGSNKTIIPGMEEAYTDNRNFGKRENANEPGGTFVPNQFGTVSSEKSLPTHKPVVGFLYSISRSGAGEYWPLHIGSNIIGRSKDCDVALEEATVSEQHATLVVQQMKNPEKIIAWINDSGSTCGTMVNGESLGFDRRECFNCDIITIGEHYDLYFILIDAKQIGLNVCRNFMPTKSSPKTPNRSQNAQNPYAAAAGTHFTQGYGQDAINQQDGTVGLDEPDSNPQTKPGRTIFM